jgi:hypothetical protein
MKWKFVLAVAGVWQIESERWTQYLQSRKFGGVR